MIGMRASAFRLVLAGLLLAGSAACTDGEPERVTQTVRVRVLPRECGAAMAAAKMLLGRVDYYPHLVAAAAQSEGWPRRVMAESRALSKKVRERRRAFIAQRTKCLRGVEAH